MAGVRFTQRAFSKSIYRENDDMDFTELSKQSPYLAAVIVIVWMFIQAQKSRDQFWVDAQKERDKLFMDTIKENNTVISSIAGEVQKNTEAIISHTTEMRGAQTALLRAIEKTPPMKRRKLDK